MHFIAKLLHGISDVAVHRVFLRYGKGDYEGPAAEINVARAGKVRVYSTYRYQDLIASIFLKVIPDETITTTGLILGSTLLDDALARIGITAPPFTKKPRTRLYQTKISGKFFRDQLLRLYDQIGEEAFIFCNLTGSTPGWQHRSKVKLPSARKEIPLAEQLKFSKSRVPAGTAFVEELVESLAPDFKNELPVTSFAFFRLVNAYHIDELIFPSDRDQLSSSDLRQKTKRKGTLIRTLQVDDVELHREHPFTA